MCRRAAALALILATGCKTRLYDASDLGFSSGNGDLAQASDDGMIDAPDFAVAADLSSPPDLSSTDAFVCPGILVAPDPIYLGCGASVVAVNILDPCMTAVKIQTIALSGMDAGHFQLSGLPGLPVTLAPGAGFPISVSTAQQTGAVSAFLDIAGSSPMLSIPVLAGPSLVVAPKSLVFKSEPVGAGSSPKSASLTNVESCALHITGVTFSGPNAGDFEISGAIAQTVAPNGGPGVLQVLFTPTAIGPRSSTLSVFSDDPRGPATIQLSGTGI
jgi:hypothetical protein